MWLKGTFSVNWKTCFDLLFWLNHGYNLKSCAAPHSPCANLSAYTGFAVQTNLCKNVHGCVWLKIVHRFFLIFFFCAHGRRCIQVHIARGCKGVCVRVDLHAFPLCMLSKQFLLSANRRHFSRNFILVPVSVFRARNRSISDLDIWLLRKWTHNTVMWPVKGMCPEWFFFFFFFLQGHVNEYFQFKTDDSWCLCSAWIIQYLAVLYFTLSTGTHAH